MYSRILIAAIVGVVSLHNIRAAGASAAQPVPVAPVSTASSRVVPQQKPIDEIALKMEETGKELRKFLLIDPTKKSKAEIDKQKSLLADYKTLTAQLTSLIGPQKQEASAATSNKYEPTAASSKPKVALTVAGGLTGAGAAALVGGGITMAAFALTTHTQRIRLDSSVLGQQYKVILTFMPVSFFFGSDRTYSFTMDLTNASAIKLYDAKGVEIAQRKGDKHGELYTELSGQTPVVVVNQGKGCLKSIAVEGAGATTPKRTSKTKSISMGENRCKDFKFILKAPDSKTISIDYDTTK